MTRSIVWSEKALSDFENLIEFIARDSLQNAIRISDRIEHSINLLSTTPFGRTGRVLGTYEAVVPKIPFIVVYELIDQKSLGIRRIIHTSRDWSQDDWPKDD